MTGPAAGAGTFGGLGNAAVTSRVGAITTAGGFNAASVGSTGTTPVRAAAHGEARFSGFSAGSVSVAFRHASTLVPDLDPFFAASCTQLWFAK